MAENAPRQHWRAMTDTNSNYFTFGDILQLNDGRDMTVRVVKAVGGLIEGNLDGKVTKNRKVLLTFAGVERPLGLNPTNARTITSIYGTPYPADWEAQRITLTLYVAKTKVKGETVDCVRIRPTKPAAGVPVYGEKAGATEQPAEPFDVDGWCAALADCSTVAELDDTRSKLNAAKPPKQHRTTLAAAIEKARERITKGAAL